MIDSTLRFGLLATKTVSALSAVLDVKNINKPYTECMGPHKLFFLASWEGDEGGITMFLGHLVDEENNPAIFICSNKKTVLLPKLSRSLVYSLLNILSC